MSEVIEPAVNLCVLLGSQEDAPQNLGRDWPTRFADKRLMSATLQRRKQRSRLGKNVFHSVSKKLLVEQRLSGRKSVPYVEHTEIRDSPDFAHQ